MLRSLQLYSRLFVSGCLAGLLILLGSGKVVGESAKGTWDSRFTLPPGLDGPVSSMVTMGNFLLVGGSFSHAGNVEAHNLALWDGGHWMPFAGGVNGPVASMVLDGNGLYVAGDFTVAGGVRVQGIAHFNGIKWDDLHANPQGLYTYIPPYITSMFSQGGSLYVSGGFLKIGGISSVGIARFDGRVWHSMEGGVLIPGYGDYGAVQTITGDGRNIYAGGQFTQAGSVQATNLARWNGQHWERVGDFAIEIMDWGVGSPQVMHAVEKLAFSGGTLYAFGDFLQVDGNAITNFAKWNGTQWQSAGSVDGMINEMKDYLGGLLVVGGFHHIGGVTATNAALFRQGKWSSLGINTAGSFYSVNASSNRVYLGGSFDLVNGISAGNIIQYDGVKYSALGAGRGNDIGGEVESLATDGVNVFATGNFDVAGGLPVSGVAKWDGTKWSSLGKPFHNQNVYRASWFAYGLARARSPSGSPQVAMVGSRLYLSGQFEMPDGGATNLACWDGREWSSVDGATGWIESMVSDGKKIYLSGSLSFSADVYRSGVISWDGTNWGSVPWNGNFSDPSLFVDGTNLYMAKDVFSRTPPPSPGNGGFNPGPIIPELPNGRRPATLTAALKNFTVAKWDGQTFTDYGEIPELAYVNALAAQGNTIYVAGYGTNYNGTSLLFRWNGNAWEQVSVPFDGYYSIRSIVLQGQKIYLGGYFTTANRVIVDGLREWDGFGWKNLGITDGYVNSMVASGNKLFVGGSFSTVGGTKSGNFGIWTEGR